MKATIWKYPFDVVDEFSIDMPAGARVLSVQMQGEQPCMWAAVRPNESMEQRRFAVFGTGHPIRNDEQLDFIGTFQMMGGSLVFHLFERTERRMSRTTNITIDS